MSECDNAHMIQLFFVAKPFTHDFLGPTEYQQISQSSSQLEFSRRGNYGVPCSQIRPLYQSGKNC